MDASISDSLPVEANAPFQHLRGFGYRLTLPESMAPFSNGQQQFHSPLALFENGIPLKFPHDDYINIIYSGGGGYNHWGNSIVFSTSDNTDPNANGRKYEVRIKESATSSRASWPGRVHIYLSTSCNLWCRICRDKPFMSPAMTFDEFCRITEQLLPVPDFRLDGGGELLLYYDLPKIIERLKMKNQPFFTSTNGMLLTEEKARMLAESTLHHIQISVDSPDPKTLEWIRRGANFERIINNVKTLVKVRKEVGRPFLITFHAAVMQENVNQLPDLVRLSKTLGIEGVTACHLYAMDCTDPFSSCFWNQIQYNKMREAAILTAREIDSFYYGPPLFNNDINTKNIKPSYCLYPTEGAVINPDCTVAPCCGASDFIMGDLRTHSFEEIWNNQKYDELRKSYNSESPSLNRCMDCMVNCRTPGQWKSYFVPKHWPKIHDYLMQQGIPL